jgi:hypothetical protein
MLKFNLNSLRHIFLLSLVFHSVNPVFCQDSEQVQTLFNKDTKTGYLWSPGIKFNSIQKDVGSVIELYGGPLFNKSFLIGLAGGVNFGHPRVNYGYFGLIMQYIYKPNKLLHFSGQTLFAYGTTRDYEQEKSSLFDNFGNVTGARYLMFEPGINMELNLKESMRMTTGVSYRFINGLNENSEFVSMTKVTESDMSGINIRIGLVFGKRTRDRNPQ